MEVYKSVGKQKVKTTGEILIYKPKGQKAHIEVSLQEGSVWLNLNQISALFDRDKSVISRHLRSIFKSGELTKKATVAKNATTAADGKT